MEEKWMGKFRTLALLLIFSGGLNIALLGALIYASVNRSEKGVAIAKVREGGQGPIFGNRDALEKFKKLSFRELVSHLTNKEPVEEGFLKRDLALAALVKTCHFNLEKALAGTLFQKREVLINPEETIVLFPGLTHEQFQAVIRYAYEVKWPLTTEGLYKALQKGFDETLGSAFAATPEFQALEALFQKSGASLDPSLLIALISEGPFEILDRLFKEQEQMLDVSVEKRQRILLSYLRWNSKTAAKLLLKTDFAFALKRLSDTGILSLVALLEGKSPEAELFCLELLKSPRTDAVWQLAAEKLYAFAGEVVETPVDVKGALARFLPERRERVIPQQVVPAKVGGFRTHVVQDGESLWKIARQHKVKVEEIVKLNELEKDRLVPGMTLRIPE